MDLLKVRVIGFGYELLVLLATGALTFLASSDFQALVTSHFGETAITGLILLLVTGGVKHLRNLRVLKNLGSDEKVVLI